MIGGQSLSTWREKLKELQGLPLPCPSLHRAVDPDSPTGASVEDKPCPERGRGYPRSPSTWCRLFPGLVSPQGSFPRKLGAQERVKRTAEGRQLPGVVLDRWARCPESARELCQE